MLCTHILLFISFLRMPKFVGRHSACRLSNSPVCSINFVCQSGLICCLVHCHTSGVYGSTCLCNWLLHSQVVECHMPLLRSTTHVLAATRVSTPCALPASPQTGYNNSSVPMSVATSESRENRSKVRSTAMSTAHSATLFDRTMGTRLSSPWHSVTIAMLVRET